MNKFLIAGEIFQFQIIIGSLANEPTLTENYRDTETYYCSFNINTRTSEGKHTVLGCYIDGDKAYDFGRNYHAKEILILFAETIHVYDGMGMITNRTHVLSWVSIHDMVQYDFPELSEDEYEAVIRFLNIYRSAAPFPSDDDIYITKAYFNKWPKKRSKVKKKEEDEDGKQ